MITATLQNVTKEGEGASFYVVYSDGTERNYRYPVESFNESDLRIEIESELKKLNSIDTTFVNIAKLKGKTFQLDKDKLTEVK